MRLVGFFDGYGMKHAEEDEKPLDAAETHNEIAQDVEGPEGLGDAALRCMDDFHIADMYGMKHAEEDETPLDAAETHDEIAQDAEGPEGLGDAALRGTCDICMDDFYVADMINTCGINPQSTHCMFCRGCLKSHISHSLQDLTRVTKQPSAGPVPCPGCHTKPVHQQCLAKVGGPALVARVAAATTLLNQRRDIM